jgi:sugar fermentation stimulation protein A
MKYPQPLIKCKLIKRYKRFLVDIQLMDGQIMTVHCPNSGSMKTCFEAGWDAYISKSSNPKRKLAHTLELVHNGNSFICVNTGMANKLVLEALNNNIIPELDQYTHFKAEVPYGNSSRIDILAMKSNEQAEAEKCYIEIKSVSMVRNHQYAFPDAVTVRGQKHLDELMLMKEQGHHAVMLFLLMRNDGNQFEAAAEIDPIYAQKLTESHQKGVQILVYQTEISPDNITLTKINPSTLYGLLS